MPEITRAEIVAALTGVSVEWDGATYEIAPSPAQPPALAVWQAFPDWQFSVPLTLDILDRTWLVYVILPAPDPNAWTSATDAVLRPVRAALLKVGHVSRIEPIALVAADQSLTMPAVAFTLVTN